MIPHPWHITAFYLVKSEPIIAFVLEKIPQISENEVPDPEKWSHHDACVSMVSLNHEGIIISSIFSRQAVNLHIRPH